MKKKIHKILGVGLTLVMAVSLIAAFAAPVAASPDEEAWSKFDYPVTGAAGDWFMDTTIDGLGPMAKAIDGTLYLYMDNTAATPDIIDDLFTSTDEGRIWEATSYKADLFAGGTVTTDPIVDIACSSDDADILYVATASNVYKSDDAGDADSWTEVDPAGMTILDLSTKNEVITSIAVGYASDVPYVYIGTTDTTVAYGGDVYYMSDVAFGVAWTALLVDDGAAVPNTDLDVYTVNTSPFFDDDTELDVVVTDATYTAVVRNIGGAVGVWAEVAELQQDDTTSFESIAASDISYVEDFDEEYEMFVGVTEVAGTGDGDVFRIEEVLALDLDIGGAGTGTDVASLDVVGGFGATSMVAGATVTSTALAIGPADIFYSTDDGDSWDAADKAPTGLTAANATDTVSNLVIVDDDFADNGIAWCASEVTTGGQEGGVHITTDFGATWNGISMIDTDMGAGVNDIAFTADYGTGDAPAFMVTRITADATRSVWKYDGTNWERVYECLIATYDLDLVEVSPGYADDEALFIAEVTDPWILYSHDGGATFTEMSRQPAAITSWVVIDDETIITGAAAGGIWKTSRYGRRAWEDYSITAGAITDLAISPDFANDHTVLAGDDDSLVFISTDEGEEWDEVSASDLADDIVTAVGDTYVAFDPGYADNNTFYVASADGIGRCVVDPDEDWGDQVIDDMGALAGFLAAGDMVVSADGTLYVADATAVSGPAAAVTEVTAVAADEFTITQGAVTLGDSGNITVSTGSVLVTPSGNATVSGGTAAVTINAGGSAPWATTTLADTLVVEALADNSNGTWTNTNTETTAGITFDDDDPDDAWVVTAAGAFSLPDAEIVGETGVPAVTVGTGGVNRSLNPTDDLVDIVWELPVSGFALGETLAWNLRLTYGSNILYGIDTTMPSIDIWAYEDTLAAPVILTSPVDGVSIPDTDEATFDWVDLNADTVEFYQLELNAYADFSGPDLGATGIDDDTWSTGADVLDAGTTYYWRVTVTDPVSSRTSAEWSFTTKVAPVEAPIQVRPLPGSQDIILLPTFSWLDMPGAVSYDIEIAPTAAFTAGVIRGTSMVNAWLLDTELEYSTTYYWRVRGISAAGIPVGDWVVSIFTTMAEPVPAPPPVVIEPTPPPVVEVPAPEMITPTWIYAIIGIGAALAIVVIVLIVRTRRVP